MVILQLIYVEWIKKSRGAPGAERRNAVAKSLPITPEDCNFLYKIHNFVEDKDFKQGYVEGQALDHIPQRSKGLLLEYQNNELVIGYQWDVPEGKPGRYDKRYALRLGTGEYGRLVVNNRQTDYENGLHWYEQYTYNIAVVNQPTTDLFGLSGAKPEILIL